MPARFLKPILMLLGLLLAFGATGHAQETGKNPAMVRFTVWGDWAGKDLYLKRPGSSSKPDDDFIKLELLDLGYSAAVPFLRGGPIEICTPLEKDGETIWQTVMNIVIPAGIREPLVLIIPNGNGATQYIVYDLHPSVFPYGDYHIVNLSKMHLFAKLDDTVLRLSPGTSSHFKGAGKDKMNVWLRVAAEDTEKNAKVVYSSMMRNRSDKRMFMFFNSANATPDAPISVRTLVDFAPAPEQ
jgi:hypothetical protein